MPSGKVNTCRARACAAQLPFQAVWLGLFLTLPVGGCATSYMQPDTEPRDHMTSYVSDALAPEEARQQRSREGLEALWKLRRQATRFDYPIGPGDMVRVSVPSLPELGDRNERVSGDGTIALPMVGTVKVLGLTEAQIRQQIKTRLTKYMYHPQVDVLVTDYRSRQVAVVGAVKTPGPITLSTSSETVLDVIGRSGGLTADAGDKLVLIPTDAKRITSIGRQPSLDPTADADQSGAVVQTQAMQTNPMQTITAPSWAQADPLIINFHSTSLSGADKYLALPVRPGDVIVVPGGGDVMVVGWVQNPGHFKIGSGLTVLGAIGAAGGPMYAGDISDIRLIRTADNDRKEILPIDLKKIQYGQEPDLPVQGNDVVDVPYSSVKIGPYVFYNILTRLGYGLPAFAF